ncbi:MAG: heme lyase CcmF/NrfE family subunit [Acidobacteria bacterium]|nr:heme lyase CcmF/NrfE family subunit [Acidobacteriota bacterium]
MIELGRFAILLALGSAVWAAAAGLYGARTRREDAIRSAEDAVRAAAITLTIAAVILFRAFLTRDFSVAYVANYSSRGLSVFYTLGAFWAGQPGSLLLWAWVLSLYSVAVVHQNRARNRDLMAYVVPTLGGTIALFALLLVIMSNPFDRLAVVPADGQGLNPLLQNYGQWFHPIALYMGYVGFTIPFAFCIAALATGNLGDVWVRTVRKWTLWAWLFLAAGIIFGMRWAYVELGWGGYWGWDPVENASLMPWLTGTAYLHSVMIQEKKGMLRVWNVFLAVATFILALFGTFLTRSGVVSSVHAFAQSSIGPYLIAAIAVLGLLSGWLIAYRLPELRSKGVMESVVSREASFLLNNLLLVAIAFAIFWGTVFPLLAEAVRGVKVSVGPPFFEAVVGPMGVALLGLIGFCPLLAWRKASGRNLRRNFVFPLGVALATLAALAAISPTSRRGPLLVLTLSAFVAATIVSEFYRGARARRRIRGEGWGTAVTRLTTRNPRRYGGYIIHLGVVVLLVGVALHTAYKQETRASLKVGEKARVGGYVLELRDLRTAASATRLSTIAEMSLRRASSGASLGSMRAERNSYENQEQPTTEVGIRSTPVEDLYVILESADPAKRVASFAFLVNPAVFWIWFGGVIMMAGGLLVAWPERKSSGKEVADAAARERVPA